MKTTLDLQQLCKTRRFRESSKISVSDMYTLFPNKDKVSAEDFLTILSTYNQILMEYIIHTGYQVRLPRKLGTFSIRSFLSKRKMVDFWASKLAGERVHFNPVGMEIEGVTFHWNKKTPYCLHPNKTIFKFSPHRAAKKKLANIINTTGNIAKYLPKNI